MWCTGPVGVCTGPVVSVVFFRQDESPVDGRGHLPLHGGVPGAAALHPLHLTQEVSILTLTYLPSPYLNITKLRLRCVALALWYTMFFLR